MGCYFSKIPRDTKGRIFRVSNVYDFDADIGPGKIEVLGSELILYHRHKEPIRWSLLYLRRYGFGKDWFSFESGQKCPTGRRLYTFKCVRADEIFDLVHEAMQTIVHRSHKRIRQTLVKNGVHGSVKVRQSSRQSSVVYTRDLYESGWIHLSEAGRMAVAPYDPCMYRVCTVQAAEQRQCSQQMYFRKGTDNADVRRNSQDHAAASQIDPQSQTQALRSPHSDTGDGRTYMEGIVVKHTKLDDFRDSLVDQSMYINVEAGSKFNAEESNVNISINASAANATNTNSGQLIRASNTTGCVSRHVQLHAPCSEHNYINVGDGSFNYGLEALTTPVPVTCISQRSFVSGELNYIELDAHRTDDEPTTMVPSDYLGKRTESAYSMIDLNRTVALHNALKEVSDVAEGGRTTRHNSTLT